MQRTIGSAARSVSVLTRESSSTPVSTAAGRVGVTTLSCDDARSGGREEEDGCAPHHHERNEPNLDAVHHGHQDVGDDEVDRLVTLPQDLERDAPVLRHVRRVPGRFELGDEQLGRDRRVVHHENAHLPRAAAAPAHRRCAPRAAAALAAALAAAALAAALATAAKPTAAVPSAAAAVAAASRGAARAAL